MTSPSEILAQNRQASGEYGNRLANHLSMAVLALGAMGASRARIAEFADAYRAGRNLAPPPTAQHKSAPHAVDDLLGDRRQEAAARHIATDLIATGGRDLALGTLLPVLLPGLAASAFHPMIRTAYAVEANDDQELAVALAYWIATYCPLGVPDPTRATTGDWRVALTALRTSFGDGQADLPDGLIVDRMEAVSRRSDFAASAHSLTVGEDGLRHLAEAAIALFAATGDFTALHGMTATHAIRILMPWIADRPTALRHHWLALAAAYLTMGAPPVPDENALRGWRSRDTPDWRALHATAVASNDDHRIKAIYSAWREADAYGDDGLYRYAAARYCGLVVA